MTNLWETIEKQYMSRVGEISEYDTAPGLNPVISAYEPVISHCLQLLHSCSTGTMLYLLNCLCPGDFSILDLVCLDLNLPHHHTRLPKMIVRLKLNSYENLLSYLRACTSIVPVEDYACFWLELTRRCLLTCPVDSNYYREDESGKELFCQILRSELVERILRID